MNRTPASKPDSEAGEAIRNAARRILTNAQIAIEDRARPDAKLIHDFRRCIKRWRALLFLVDPLVGPDVKKLKDDARDMARALGGARDAQSARDALADLSEHGLAFSNRSTKSIQTRIDTVRLAAESTTLTDETRKGLSQTLKRNLATVDIWRLNSITFADIAARLAGGYRVARRAMPKKWFDADGEDLHELRKRIIHHRYQMEIVVPFWKNFGTMWIEEAQRLRTSLGKHQDLLVLTSLTAPHQPLAPWRARLLPAIAQRKAHHGRVASRIAIRMFVERPKDFRRKLEAIWNADDRSSR
jgi:CHAD domain-containing protein